MALTTQQKKELQALKVAQRLQASDCKFLTITTRNPRLLGKIKQWLEWSETDIETLTLNQIGHVLYGTTPALMKFTKFISAEMTDPKSEYRQAVKRQCHNWRIEIFAQLPEGQRLKSDRGRPLLKISS